MRVIKQATQTDVILGPFVDDTDFKSLETAYVSDSSGIDIDAISAITKSDITLSCSSGNGYFRHVSNGNYALTLSSDNTATLGALRVTYKVNGALPGWEEFLVVSANVYDSLVGNTDYLYTDALQIASTSSTATTLKTNIPYLDEAISGIPTVLEIDTQLGSTHSTGSWAAGTTSSSSITDTANAVWASTTRTLTSLGTLVADIDSLLSANHGVGSWLTGDGTGSSGGPLILGTIPVSYTLTLAPEGSGTPIANAEVHISTDPAGLNVIAAGTTNVLGELVINGQTVFWLPKGTFYYWRSKAGYSFTNPDTEVVI